MTIACLAEFKQRLLPPLNVYTYVLGLVSSALYHLLLLGMLSNGGGGGLVGAQNCRIASLD